MEIVVDASVFFSALIGRGKTLDLLFSKELDFISPEYMLSEVEEHRDKILKESGLSEADLDRFIALLEPEIEFITANEFDECLEEADKICPDPDDLQYFALALKRKCSVWSYDPHFEQQSKVKTLKTKDVVELISELKGER